MRFIICADPLSQKWAGLLQELLQRKTFLKKDSLFYGWLSKTRDVGFLCQELNRHIDIINNFYSNMTPHLHYHIPLRFEPESVDQNLLNQIHHDFEVLTGPNWALSKRFKLAPRSVRFSIQQLNILCHEIEWVLWAKKALHDQRPHGALIGSIFPAKKLPLLDAEKAGSQIHFDFGDVRLHYGQMGKTHHEAYLCNDSAIASDSMTELRYLTGEFDICFGSDMSPEDKAYELNDFKEWLKKKGADHTLNFGFPVVAKLDRKQFTPTEPLQILAELYNYDDILRISVCREGHVFSRDFDYLPQDSEVNNPHAFRWQSLLNPFYIFDEVRSLVFQSYYGNDFLQRFFNFFVKRNVS